MNAGRVIRGATPGALLAMSAAALALDPVFVDGVRDVDEYPAASAVQTSSVIDIVLTDPIPFQAQTDNSNEGGVVASSGGDFKSAPDTVTTGFEIEISLVEAGWDGLAPIRVAGFINGGGGDFSSNQWIGSIDNTYMEGGTLPPNPGNPAGIDLSSAAFPGTQWVEITTTAAAPLGVTIDGELGGSEPYALAISDGSPWEQNVPTGFGDSNTGDVIEANGSEINAVWGFIDPGDTPAITDDVLHLLITGNTETNFNRLELFIDANPSGEAVLSGMPEWGSLTNLTGLTWDAGFSPNYYLKYNAGLGGSTQQEAFLDAATLGAGGVGRFTGGIRADNTPLFFDPAAMDMVNQPPSGGLIRAENNNSNTGGVAAQGQGIGSDSAFGTPAPGGVTTGTEWSIDLDAIGYDGGGTIDMTVFLSEGNQLSNQVSGGVPLGSGSLGRADGVNFEDIAGTQTLTVSTTPVAQAITVNGTLDAAAYGPALYVNDAGGTGNSTSLGDQDSGGGADVNADGSEINAIYAAVRQEDDGTGRALKNVLYVFVAGNVGNYNRLWAFYDLKEGGQNELRGDNPNIDDESFNSYEGLTFEEGVEMDFATVYALGFFADGNVVTHFASGAELFTEGTSDPNDVPAGGRFDIRDKDSTNVMGDLEDRAGFRNNVLSSIDEADGSELDNLHVRVDNDALNLFIGGNLRTNFTKVEIFFDIIEGRGQNTLVFSDLPVEDPLYDGNPQVDDPEALSRMGGPFEIPDTDPVETQPGLTFDNNGDMVDDAADFLADHYVTFTQSAPDAITGQPTVFGNIARLRGALPDTVFSPAEEDAGAARFWGSTVRDDFGFFFEGDDNSEEALLVIDNSNVGGVAASMGMGPFAPDDTDPATVDTGIELAIPLDQFTVPNMAGNASQEWDGATPFKVMVFLNGQFHEFGSNQVLPPMCLVRPESRNELGEIREVDFSEIAGDQFVRLSPTGSDGGFVVTNSANIITDCVEPQGACCIDGMCMDLGVIACNDMGGEFFEGEACDSFTCPEPEGACCIDGVCQVFTAAQCDGAGGEYQGDDTACEGDDAVSCPCPGDADGNGVVDLDDFSVLAVQFGSAGPEADFNNDGVVDLDDFSVLAVNFGCTSL